MKKRFIKVLAKLESLFDTLNYFFLFYICTRPGRCIAEMEYHTYF